MIKTWTRNPDKDLLKRAVHNSYYVRELLKAQRKIAMLRKRIKTLEKEHSSMSNELIQANRTTDMLLLLSKNEETLRYEIRMLKKQRDKLAVEISRMTKRHHSLNY